MPKVSKTRNEDYKKRIARGYCGCCGSRPIDSGVTCCICRDRAKAVYNRKFFYSRAKVFRFKNTSSVVSAKDLWRLWHKQKGFCALTGISLTRENAQIDHKISALRGGCHVIENLQWVTKDVNHAKQRLTSEEFIALCHLVVEYHQE